MHDAIIRLNEGMQNSYFELLELGCRPQPSLWQNIAQLCFHCAVRYQEKRLSRIRAELNELPPSEALKLTPKDVQQRYGIGADRRDRIHYLASSKTATLNLLSLVSYPLNQGVDR